MKYPVHKWNSKSIEAEASQQVASRDVTTFAGVLGSLPNPDPVLRKTGNRLQTYRQLTADWEVFSAIELVHGGLQDFELVLEPGEADPGAVAELEERMKLWDIPGLLSEAVDGRLFGYQPFEYMWAKDDSHWFIEDVVGKPPEWFNFSADNALQLITKDNPQGLELLPYKFGCATHRASYQNPYGEAALSRVFWPVAFKKGGMKFWVKFMEKYGMPWLVGKLPRGAGSNAQDELLSQLATMVQDAVGVIPDDSSVDMLESPFKASSGGLYKSFANYCDAAIDKVILSSETIMSVSKEGGSDQRHDSAESAKASRSVIKAIGKMGLGVINHAIQWEWHFNFDGPAPEMVIPAQKKVQRDLAERDQVMTQQGVRFKKDYYVKNYGLADDEFELADPAPSGTPGFSEHPAGCQCQGCRPSPQKPPRIRKAARFQEDPKTEAERRQARDNQRILEEMIELAGGDPAAATNQAFMEQALSPVMDLINGADSYEEIMQGLAGAFPEMSTNQLERRIESAIFLSEIWGRLTSSEENEADDDE